MGTSLPSRWRGDFYNGFNGSHREQDTERTTDSHLRGRADSKVYVGLSQEVMRSGPEYDDSTPITREYENRLYLHYGEPPYWLQEAGRPPVFRRA